MTTRYGSTLYCRDFDLSLNEKVAVASFPLAIFGFLAAMLF